MSYQIVTDATADMDYSLLDAHVIPMKVYINQKEFLYGQMVILVSEHFMKHCEKER